ncbi:sigma-70 family RNA polymerase sigma factor [Evansella cellulosilytica]|uniref:sigma-70 family RNA polymerase sigma factor n=1 Tax=Evansella cellulosilytica TaxID=1413 RepID=UPI00032258CC|nr:sigma-70 family RNA polymerase sigma factor [Evansella cellulosilytica]
MSVLNRQDTMDDVFLEVLINQYYEALVNVSYTYVKNWSTAEDIVQDVFIKILNSYHLFENRSSIKTWLYKITMNKSKDYLRKTYFKRVVIMGVIDRLITDRTPEDNIIQKSMDKELAECIFILPIKYREVIILFYYEDLSLTEMGELLGENVSTLKSRLQRARRRLKEVLSSRGITYESI